MGNPAPEFPDFEGNHSWEAAIGLGTVPATHLCPQAGAWEQEKKSVPGSWFFVPGYLSFPGSSLGTLISCGTSRFLTLWGQAPRHLFLLNKKQISNFSITPGDLTLRKDLDSGFRRNDK